MAFRQIASSGRAICGFTARGGRNSPLCTFFKTVPTSSAWIGDRPVNT